VRSPSLERTDGTSRGLRARLGAAVTRAWEHAAARPEIAVVIALLALLIPLAAGLPWWATLVSVGAVGWRLWLLLRGGRLPKRLWLLLATAAGTLLVLAQYGTLMGQQPGLALLAWLTGLKALEGTGPRDQRVLLALALVLCAGMLLVHPNPLGLLWADVVSVTLLAALYGGSQPGLKLAGPLIRRFTTAGFLVALLLFFLFPRPSGPLMGVPNPTPNASTGLSEEMRPGIVGRLAESDAPAFRVRFEGTAPAASQRYWRVLVLDRFDGERWYSDPETPLGQQAAAQTFFPADEALRYTITPEPSERNWLPALDWPTQTTDGVSLTTRLELRTLRPGALSTRAEWPLSAYLDGLFEGPGGRQGLREQRDALELPEDSNPRLQALGRALAAEHGNDAGRVAAVLHRIRAQPYRYTLRPPPVPGRLGMDRFFFETQAGFCEHYAGATAIILRAAGIPTRVVTGYLGGEYNRNGDYWLVRQSDAHAWMEVRLDQQGWVRIDPTAAIAPERIEGGLVGALSDTAGLPLRLQPGFDWLNTVVLGMDALRYGWEGWVMGFGYEQQLWTYSPVWNATPGATAWRGWRLNPCTTG